MNNRWLVVNSVSPKTEERIFKKISIDEATDCWVWGGSLNSGYGEVRVDKVLHKVHRFIYAWLIEPIPKGKGKNIPVLDHIICDNRACCNPAHLELTSDTNNILRGNGATARKVRQTHCKNGHLLPLAIRGHRRCMICHRAWNRRNYAKNPIPFREAVKKRRIASLKSR